jgi:hypothetical protein
MSDLHERDIFVWTVQQAALLRSGRVTEIDSDNIAFRLEMFADEIRSNLSGTVLRVCELLLTKHYLNSRLNPDEELVIRDYEEQIVMMLKHDPSHRLGLEALIQKSYERAMLSLEYERELTRRIFPEQCPWQLIPGKVKQLGRFVARPR